MSPMQDLKDPHYTDAILDYDFILRYGIFGYGYTQQLQQKNMSPQSFIKESLLFRSTKRSAIIAFETVTAMCLIILTNLALHVCLDKAIHLIMRMTQAFLRLSSHTNAKHRFLGFADALPQSAAPQRVVSWHQWKISVKCFLKDIMTYFQFRSRTGTQQPFDHEQDNLPRVLRSPYYSNTKAHFPFEIK